MGLSWALLALVALIPTPPLRAADGPFSPAGIRFFESEIRPVLHGRCASCHSPGLRTSGLSVASRDSLIEGGSRGAAISLDNPSDSLILSALRHDSDLKMPADGKLSDAKIAAFERWIGFGAPWPEESAPTRAATGAKHWSFEPIARPEAPEVSDSAWIANPIDRFVLARLEERGLAPSPEAQRATLARRVHLDLTGLLPSRTTYVNS